MTQKNKFGTSCSFPFSPKISVVLVLQGLLTRCHILAVYSIPFLVFIEGAEATHHME